MNTYSIGEVAKIMNLSISTLRYYDKEGLLDNVERSEGGIRIFKDTDISQLRMLECLKNTGMPLKDIRIFFEWCKQGDETIEQRYQMFVEQRAKIVEQIEQLQNTLQLIDYKCAFYQTALEAGTLSSPQVTNFQRTHTNPAEYVAASHS